MDKKDIQNIRIALMSWNQSYTQKNRVALVGFFKGYDASLSQREGYNSNFSSLFSEFILHYHNIRHIAWDFQVETFAYRNKIEWIIAFDQLFNEFIGTIQWKEDKVFLAIPKTEVEIDSQIIDTSQRISKYKTESGVLFKSGTIIKFVDKIGEEYKKFVNYDIYQKEPSWETLTLGNGKNNYQHIRFFIENDATKNSTVIGDDVIFHKVERIWGFHTTQIKFLAQRNGKYYAYSDLFEIELDGAIENHEIEITTQRHKMDFVREEYATESLSERHENYKMGLITYSEFLNQFGCHSHYFGHYEKFMNYNLGMNGWSKKSKK